MNGLESLRRFWKLKQLDVAEATGISQHRISEFERGLRPTPEQLRALAEFFGVPESLEYMLMEPVPPAVPPPPDWKERIREMRQREQSKK